jgi:hypothetical protein
MEFDNTEKKINEEIFRRLLFRVYSAEHDNFKTQKLKPNEMNKRIRDIIEQEVSKDEN